MAMLGLALSAELVPASWLAANSATQAQSAQSATCWPIFSWLATSVAASLASPWLPVPVKIARLFCLAASHVPLGQSAHHVTRLANSNSTVPCVPARTDTISMAVPVLPAVTVVLRVVAPPQTAPPVQTANTSRTMSVSHVLQDA